MSDELVDVRTELAASDNARVEVGLDGVVHVLAGNVTLHLDRAVCEELTTTLARGMVVLGRLSPKRSARPPRLRVVRAGGGEGPSGAKAPHRQTPPSGETVDHERND